MTCELFVRLMSKKHYNNLTLRFYYIKTPEHMKMTLLDLDFTRHEDIQTGCHKKDLAYNSYF